MPFDAGSVAGRLELGLEGWKKSIETVKADQQSMAGFAMRHGEEIQALGKKFAMAGAAITGALTAIVFTAAKAGDEFDEMSDKTGISVGTLSTLKLAADKSGTSIGAVAAGMKFLGAQMIEASTATDKSKTVLGALKITATDTTGKLRPMNEVLFDVADRFAGMENGAIKTKLAVAIFGKAGMDMIPILNLGSKGLRENEDAARKLGIEWSGPATKAAAVFMDATEDLKAAGAGLSKTIGMALMPTVLSIVEGMTGAIVKVREWAAANPGLTAALSSVALAAGGFLTVSGGILLIIPKIITGMVTMAAAVHTTVASMALAVGAIGLVVGALAVATVKIIEMVGATERANKSEADFVKTNIALENKLYDLVKSGKMTYDQFEAVRQKFDGNAAAMAMFIAHGNAGTVAQKALSEAGKAHAKVLEEQAAASNKLDPALQALFDSLDKGKDGTDALKKSTDAVTESVNKSIKSIETLSDTVFDLGKATTPVAGSIFDTFGPTFSNIMGDAADDVDAVTSVFDKMPKKIDPGITEPVKNMGDDAAAVFMQFEKAIQGVIDIFVSLGGTVDEQSSKMLEDMLNLMSAISQGNVVGAVVSVVKLVVDAFTVDLPPAFGVVKRDLMELGEISDSTAQKILDFVNKTENWALNQADEMGFLDKATQAFVETTENMTRAEREAYGAAKYLNDLMADTGVTIDNLDKYWNIAIGTVGKWQAGLFTTSEAQANLDEAFGTLVEAAQKFGSEGSDAMVDFILKTREAGLEVASVTEYVNEQLGTVKAGAISAADGLLAMAQAIAPGSAELSESNAKLKDELAAVEEKMKEVGLTAEEFDKLKEASLLLRTEIIANEEALEEMASKGEAGLKRVEDQTLIVYNAMIANGASAAEAAASIGPALDVIIQKHKDLGTEAGPAIAQLLKIRGVTEGHQELMTAIEGNDAVLKALGNTGFLAGEEGAKALQAAATSALDYRNQLVAAGMSGDEALAMMGPTLQDIHDYAAKYGVVLDENTQKMIDQAEEAGLVKDKVDMGEEAQETNRNLEHMARAFDRIAERLGIVFDKMGELGSGAAEVAGEIGVGIVGAIDGVITKIGGAAGKFKTDFGDAIDTVDGWVDGLGDSIGDLPGLPGDGEGGENGASIPEYALGGYVPRTGPALLHAGEYVIPPGANQGFVQPASRDGGSAPVGITISINGPLVSSSGVSESDLERAGERLFDIIKRQARRYGSELAYA